MLKYIWSECDCLADVMERGGPVGLYQQTLIVQKMLKRDKPNTWICNNIKECERSNQLRWKRGLPDIPPEMLNQLKWDIVGLSRRLRYGCTWLATCPGQKVHCTVKNKFRSEKKFRSESMVRKSSGLQSPGQKAQWKQIRSEKVQVRKYSQTSFRSEITVRKKIQVIQNPGQKAQSEKAQVRKYSQEKSRYIQSKKCYTILVGGRNNVIYKYFAEVHKKNLFCRLLDESDQCGHIYLDITHSAEHKSSDN